MRWWCLFVRDSACFVYCSGRDQFVVLAGEQEKIAVALALAYGFSYKDPIPSSVSH